MAPFCQGPEKPQAGCYERAHITPSEARLPLLRGRVAARVYAIGVATAMEAGPCGLYPLARERRICSTRSAMRRKPTSSSSRSARNRSASRFTRAMTACNSSRRPSSPRSRSFSWVRCSTSSCNMLRSSRPSSSQRAVSSRSGSIRLVQRASPSATNRRQRPSASGAGRPSTRWPHYSTALQRGHGCQP
jgi:hypothetical protein